MLATLALAGELAGCSADGDTAADGAPPAQPAGCALQISAGAAHTCAIKADRTLWCWGSASAGQIGIAEPDGKFPVPRQVDQLGAEVLLVRAGLRHTCAIKADHTLWCWGSNSYGQLGLDPDEVGATPVPTEVPGIGPGVVDVAPGADHTCAVKDDGSVWCWGNNAYGQLAAKPPASLVSPNPRHIDLSGASAVAIDAGEIHTCALAADSAVWCWGDNAFGQLGHDDPEGWVPRPVAGLGSAAAHVTAGVRHTCALSKGGILLCWGDSSWGQLGPGVAAGASSTPVEVGDLPAPVLRADAGGGHSCAVEGSGAVLCWGYNNVAQLGVPPPPLIVPAPAAVAPLPPVAELSAGGGHTCALAAGRPWCWGANGDGQLGDGTVAAYPAAFRGPTSALLCDDQ
ncbi:MAG: hypothetical protein HY744_10640 [Deltaproteobacteria bacterium]|nr:hypothetical protein [Deltaproteobacteria bacterium]